MQASPTNSKHLLVDAYVPGSKTRTRKVMPKPWAVYGPKHAPVFEHIDGSDVLHVGYELEPDVRNPSKLQISLNKLYLKMNTDETLLYFYGMQKAKLSLRNKIPGYAVFPCGPICSSEEVKQANQQTMYKRAWQMTYEEWKSGKPLSCDSADANFFWANLHKYMEKYKEDGRERKGRVSSHGSASSRTESRRTSGASKAESEDTEMTSCLEAQSQSPQPGTTQDSALTTYHYAATAQRQGLSGNTGLFESSSTMDGDRQDMLALHLRQMSRNVPPNATLECVIGIWKVPGQAVSQAGSFQSINSTKD